MTHGAWLDLPGDVVREFDTVQRVHFSWTGTIPAGMHIIRRKGRKSAALDQAGRRRAKQARYRASLLTDTAKRERRLAAKRRAAKALYDRRTGT